MTVIKDKLTEAINAKNNDVNTFIWKGKRHKDHSPQEEIKMMDATEEQLNSFYQHCESMLYNENTKEPGRYTLLKIIQEQREKCNVEIFIRKFETGELCSDGVGYPRHLYCANLRKFLDSNKAQLPSSEWDTTSIACCAGDLPREFKQISIKSTIEACLDSLGFYDGSHISPKFILSLGVCFTPAEIRELTERKEDGSARRVLEVAKERLGLRSHIRLNINPNNGLTYTELRAMLDICKKERKYSKLTTDQLVTLRNKVLFHFEDKVKFEAQQWEDRKLQIEKVCEVRGITLRK